MSLLLIAPNLNVQPWKEALLEADPNLEIEIWPEINDNKSVQFAVVWRDPPPVFNQFPNLKVIFSPGAGVDHILGEASVPEQVTIARTVSQSLTGQMKEYLLNAVFNYRRNIYEYYEQQQQGSWNVLPDKSKTQINIGVMGLGKIGKPAAMHFNDSGFHTKGWSKSKKQIDGIEIFSGAKELDDFLKGTNVLICLLPLTTQTRGILNLKLFKQLDHPGYLINAGRGEHLVEEDLIYAIDKGWIEGATLDVFAEEPLPGQHPFWNRTSIKITPHISSLTQLEHTVPQIVENYKRILSGLPVLNKVDRDRGY